MQLTNVKSKTGTSLHARRPSGKTMCGIDARKWRPVEEASSKLIPCGGCEGSLARLEGREGNQFSHVYGAN